MFVIFTKNLVIIVISLFIAWSLRILPFLTYEGGYMLIFFLNVFYTRKFKRQFSFAVFVFAIAIFLFILLIMKFSSLLCTWVTWKRFVRWLRSIPVLFLKKRGGTSSSHVVPTPNYSFFRLLLWVIKKAGISSLPTIFYYLN